MAEKPTRRDFLKIGSVGAAAAVLTGCQNPRRWVKLVPYVRPPEEQLTGTATWYASTCRQCPSGCGILVRVMNGRAVKIEGNPEHPLNRGKLCARGQAGLQALYNPDRLSGPVMQSTRGARNYQSISWEEAANQLFNQVQAAGSGLAVWAGSTISGHLFDLLGRFTQAIGANPPLVYDLYTALNGYAQMERASQSMFGQQDLPAYDISTADVVVSFGADFLGTGTSAVRYGIDYGAFRSQPLGKRGYLVQFEPRMTITGAKADLWLPIRPGYEGRAAQALMRLIAEQGIGPPERVNLAQSLASDVDFEQIAQDCGLMAEDLARLASIFVNAERPVAIPGNFLAGGDHGDEALAAIQALNSIAGVSGTVRLTPEAASSALAKTGYSSYSGARQLLADMSAGKVKALLVVGCNPAYDLPGGAAFQEAVKNVPFVASFTPIVDETAVWADLVLPEHSYLEAWGYEVVSPSFGTPVVSSQQPVVQPYFDTRSAADILLLIARGIPAAASVMPWSDEVAFLKEAIGQLPAGAFGGTGQALLWARFLQYGGWWPESGPVARRIANPFEGPIEVPPPVYQGEQDQFPYFLLPYPSPLLSDGRGANLPWLQASPDPMTANSWQTLVEINPVTAKQLNIVDGDIVQVESPYGQIEAPVYIYPAIRPDTIAIPTGQGHTDYGRYARNNGANLMKLIGDQVDASGSYLAWANLRVKITPTGKKTKLALFEDKMGVTQGFINQAFPGK
jgi:anaerobic selenocysteine-containing dehydrogenase